MLDLLEKAMLYFSKLRQESRKTYMGFSLFYIVQKFTKGICYKVIQINQRYISERCHPTFLSVFLLSTCSLPQSSLLLTVWSITIQALFSLATPKPNTQTHTCTHRHTRTCHSIRLYYSLLRHQHSVESFISFTVKSN